MTEKKRLLAIDGGGILGLIALGALAEIERQFREANQNPDLRLRDCFHYIGGTSTGAIIAAGLMLGKSVEEIHTLYLDQGKDIFSSAPVWMRPFYLYGRAKLVDILKREFGEATILDLQEAGADAERSLPVDRHLLIVTHNASTGSPWPLSSNRAAHYNNPAREDCNLKVPLWQLVRASTAAPVYFPAETIAFGKRERRFEDGGVTPYNNPSFQLFRMATMPEYWRNDPGAVWPAGEDRMMLVSVGNSYTEVNDMTPRSRFGGNFILSNARQVPSTLMRAMAVENDFNCRRVGRCVHGEELDREIGDFVYPLDGSKGAPPDGPRKFLYARYDIDVSQEKLDADPDLKHLREKDITLDNAAIVKDLARIGEKNGTQVDLAGQFGSDWLKL